MDYSYDLGYSDLGKSGYLDEKVENRPVTVELDGDILIELLENSFKEALKPEPIIPKEHLNDKKDINESFAY